MRYPKLTVIVFCGILALASCKKEDPVVPTRPVGGKDPVPTTEETIPDYADDYSSIAGWDYHVTWNLANVHDPSIAYYNGYYYMYGTDASYGNEPRKATLVYAGTEKTLNATYWGKKVK